MAVPPLRDLVQRVDDAVYDLMVDLETGWLVAISEAFDLVGSVWVTAPLAIGVAVYLAVVRRWRGLVYWVMTMVLSQLLIGPLKNLYERDRPPDALVETTSFSFPSGHAVSGAAIAIGLVIVLVPAGPKRRNLEILAGFFAVFMAMSRVYLRAHWASDVVAGAALGAAVAIVVAAAIHFKDSRQEIASSGSGRG
jgi:undecaprenyl-diphosphatase